MIFKAKINITHVAGRPEVEEMQKMLRLIARLIVARHECTYVRTVKKTHHFLYVLRSTGNAYDVISHRRLSGPCAPQYFGQVYAYGLKGDLLRNVSDLDCRKKQQTLAICNSIFITN